METLARSVYLRYREALGEDIGEIPQGLYPGTYLVPLGTALAEDWAINIAVQMRQSGYRCLSAGRGCNDGSDS